MNNHRYYVYITTNKTCNALYVGMTNDLVRRIQEHFENQGKPETFAGKYCCCNLVYWEAHQYVLNAINREKEIKKWRREKKDVLIREFNPNMTFLNLEIRD
ncbi:GIY-YIG nuclease family protein [Spirosoma sp.]|uniref:GIY-YIG nuclease family protein n=1 Tax=Spirosoma sp. TaxID=1899569 RepID=UPI003B3B9424